MNWGFFSREWLLSTSIVTSRTNSSSYSEDKRGRRAERVSRENKAVCCGGPPKRGAVERGLGQRKKYVDVRVVSGVGITLHESQRGVYVSLVSFELFSGIDFGDETNKK